MNQADSLSSGGAGGVIGWRVGHPLSPRHGCGCASLGSMAPTWLSRSSRPAWFGVEPEVTDALRVRVPTGLATG